MSKMKAITLTGADTAYAEVICKFFLKQFPSAFKASKGQLLEILTDILVGTKQIRYGSIPKPEALVKIRATILTAIEKELPIPVLIPWGGVKAKLDAPIDVAEVAAIWQIVAVDTAIKQFYKPGLLVHIAIEDRGAHYLYRETANAVPMIDKYSEDLFNLIRIVRGDTNIKPIKESTLMAPGSYCDKADMYADLIYDYLVASRAFPDGAQLTKEWKELEATGWKGTIPLEQREYYTGLYKNLDPELTDQQATRMLAEYLGGSKARYDLNARAEPVTEVGSYIKISFIPPIPGAPSSMFSNTLYYRTVPLNQGRTHIAPWRAKGYLEIEDGSDRVSTKITSFRDGIGTTNVIQGKVTLADNDETVKVDVETDHVVVGTALIYAMMAGPMF